MTDLQLSGQFVDLQKRDIYPVKMQWKGERITKIERVSHAPNSFILPGFIDAHVHIESSMLSPGRFAQAAVAHGTTAVLSDPHEIANVLGSEGIAFMLEDSRKVPFHFFFGVPSCVPATSFESSGDRLPPSDVEELLQRADLYFLSEMMNFPAVLNQDPEVLKKIQAAHRCGKPIDGHAPGLKGEDLKTYIAAGITTDHETETLSEAREKIEAGMHIQIREGSAARNFETLHPLIREYPSRLMFCSDDLHPEMLQSGHINEMVKRALARGYDLFEVLRIACLNPALHYQLDIGVLQKNALASFILVKDLQDFQILQTYIRGRKVFDRGKCLISYRPDKAINRFEARKTTKEDWHLPNQQRAFRVIEVQDGSLWTGSGRAEAVDANFLQPMVEKDLLMLAVKERYRDAPLQKAFVRGFGLKEGAIASSVAHDSHNIVAVGADLDSLRTAVNELIDLQGGLVLVGKGEVQTLPLPLGGLMSLEPIGKVAHTYLQLNEQTKKLGCTLQAPFMSLAFMSLLVIPELKLGDQGLFDVKNFRLCGLFLD